MINDNSSREEVIQAVSLDGMQLEHASAVFRNDREIVEKAIRQNAFAIQFASDILNNVEMRLIAIRQNPRVFDILYGSPIHANIEAGRRARAVSYNDGSPNEGSPIPINYMGAPGNMVFVHGHDVGALSNEDYSNLLQEALQDDIEPSPEAWPGAVAVPEIVPELLQARRPGILNPEAIQEIDILNQDLVDQENLEIENAIGSVSRNGLDLRYLGYLTNNEYVVYAAVEQDGRAFAFASLAIRNDPKVVLVVVAIKARAFQFASDALKNNEDIAYEAVAQNGLAFEHASPMLKEKKTFVLKVVAEDGRAYQFVDDELKKDPDVMRAARMAKKAPLELISPIPTGRHSFLNHFTKGEGEQKDDVQDSVHRAC